ncbi:MAG: hypothetical protein Q9M89_01995 [Persephonella sp.]|nr:hypothetical protein [Persephonella sp.]
MQYRASKTVTTGGVSAIDTIDASSDALEIHISDKITEENQSQTYIDKATISTFL